MRDVHPYARLNPSRVLSAVEAAGDTLCSGHLLALNSYENRVFQVGLESGGYVIAKFYRPRRWSDEAIREEHRFALTLAKNELPVVAPIEGPEGETLHYHEGFRLALFPRQGGHPPPIDDPASLTVIGRLIGQIHQIGAIDRFSHRPSIGVDSQGWQAREVLCRSSLVTADLADKLAQVSEAVLSAVEQRMRETGFRADLRLHGDFHVGNLLWKDDRPYVVDTDDCCLGPAVQDLWMLLPEDAESMATALTALLEGYECFRPFERAEIALIEPLRALRLLNFAAWLAQRWDDPAFPRAFPWFATPRYWEQLILDLQEQRSRLDEPPMTLR